jgi:hypothetical protein
MSQKCDALCKPGERLEAHLPELIGAGSARVETATRETTIRSPAAPQRSDKLMPNRMTIPERQRLRAAAADLDQPRGPFCLELLIRRCNGA